MISKQDPNTDDARDIEKTSPIGDPRKPEIDRLEGVAGQSRGNPESLRTREADIESAIANLTRLISRTDDAEVAASLVAERKAMRLDLEALRREAAGVVDLASRRR